MAGLSGFSVPDSVSMLRQLGGMGGASQLAAKFVTSSLSESEDMSSNDIFLQITFN
jgi:hypothetical protein